MIHILYQDSFEYFIKKNKTFTDNSPVRIYVNIKEDRIPLKIKTGYYLERLTSEIMKLISSTTRKIKKKKIVKMCLI